MIDLVGKLFLKKLEMENKTIKHNYDSPEISGLSRWANSSSLFQRVFPVKKKKINSTICVLDVISSNLLLNKSINLSDDSVRPGSKFERASNEN